MPTTHAEILRSLCRPLEPIPTGQHPSLRKLRGIRAVLFDVYGTLFISGTGDIGAFSEATCERALADALEAVGGGPIGSVAEGADYYFEAIGNSHTQSRRSGIDYPEVDIVEIWRQVVQKLASRGLLARKTWTRAELERLAVEYEGRANPVWPMPGLKECLRTLSQRQLLLGIVSNAQFYTPELFPALLGGRPEAWGFAPDLQYYSYQFGRAKPGLELHTMAAEALGRRRIQPAQAVYVGNDMLNDVFPASRLGFSTALFAGDARSLQRRLGDARLNGLLPDVVLTDLADLNRCI